MNIAQLTKSKYLTKNDVGEGKLLTIRGDLAVEVQVDDSGAQEELHVLYFDECEKGMVIKPVNAQLIAQITGSTDTENWDGHKIVVFEDKTIVFGGKLVGGIRVRAPRQRPAAGPAPRQAAPTAPPRRDPRQPVPRPTNPAPVSDNDGGLGGEDPNWLPSEGDLTP